MFELKDECLFLCNPPPDGCRPEMCKSCEYNEEKQRERSVMR